MGYCRPGEVPCIGSDLLQIFKWSCVSV
nr:unnamed protein product [Callosobruchus chinensis]